MIDKHEIARQARYELCRRNFWWYCHTMKPDFYTKDREYLKEICRDLQDFYESDEEILLINCPPRHGKSFSAQNFTQWVLGINPNAKIMTASYNETLSIQFSKNVRNTIQEQKADPNITVYSDIFPNVKIKHGDGSMNLWSLEGSYSNYLATSPTGTATGFGASLIIVDDLIKNAEDARNATVKEKHWEWFCNTMLSRLEKGGKIIVIMTRWANDDLAGHMLEWCKREKKKFKHINMKAIKDDNTMLCSDVLDYESAMRNKSMMGEDIFSANYQQEPIDIKGRLYTELKEYDVESAPTFRGISAYIDTADKGSDYLCMFVYGSYNNEAYVIDTVFTQESMETTEYKVAKCLYDNDVNNCLIEGNNGGEGFARSVRRILKDEFHSNKCTIKTFHQSKNKEARILSNATWVMNHIYFPKMWRNRWGELYESLYKYQREGKNAHDDSADALTGVAEQFNKESNKVRSRFSLGSIGL